MSVSKENIRKAERRILNDFGYEILCEDYGWISYVCESPNGDIAFVDAFVIGADDSFSDGELTKDERKKYEDISGEYFKEFGDDVEPGPVKFVRLEVQVISESRGFVRLAVLE